MHRVSVLRVLSVTAPRFPDSHTLVMGDDAEAVLDQIASVGSLWASAAALVVMQRYPIALRTRRSRNFPLPSAGYFITGRPRGPGFHTAL